MNVKGHEFSDFNKKEASYRKAVQLSNNIINNLKKIGIGEDDYDIKLEPVAIKKAPALALFYFNGHRLYYSYKKLTFIENLYVVSKVIELEIEALINEKKAVEDFIRDFSEDKDVEDKRKEARKLLGVDENSIDLEEINKKYKILAKEHHPDIGGSMEKFKEINNAHKILVRELE